MPSSTSHHPAPATTTTRHPIVVLGEALIDIVRAHDDAAPVREAPGGSCANVALTLGRLGHEVTLVTTLGDDTRGRRIRDWLAESNVRILAGTSARTSTAAALIDADGAATYSFDLYNELPPELVSRAFSTQPAAVHVGSIAAVLAPGAHSINDALTAATGRALLSFDPNVRPAISPDVAATRQRIEQLVEACDVIKTSDEDLAWLYPDVDPLMVAQDWSARGPLLVVVTLGSRGALYVHNGQSAKVSGVQTAVADTIGAGDTFSGALIDALVRQGVAGPHARSLLHGLDPAVLREAVVWAARAAAVTVSRPGADPPRRHEVAGRPEA